MTTSILCPQCGKPLPASAPMGLCPECLMQAGFPTGGKASAYVPPAPEELARIFPDLEILELLGRGGMGVVYKARQRELDRFVALKLLPSGQCDPAFAERFSREARALAKLNHPHIVTIYDFGQKDGLFYFVMEYVDGLNLRQLLANSKIAPAEALAIVPQVCEALQYAHNQGIVHRDIKPENILLDKNGQVKIADFGLAKITGQTPTDMTLTMAGEVMGTPHYMAPEQVEHPQSVDHRADIYSLGVVFYQMLTGELPLGHFAPPSRKVLVDVRLDEVVLRALEKEPEHRYQQADAFRSQVETIVSTPGEASSAKNTAPVVPPNYFGFEYKSKRTLWGLPLLHVSTGIDPATGKSRMAKGIVAIGNNARGIIAMGGFAMGVFAYGGFGIGVFSFSGISLGIFACGGLALGLLLAYGGVALSSGGALGGLAIGYLALGGHALGIHAEGSNAHDPLAQALLGWGVRPWTFVAIQLMLAVCLLVQIILPKWLSHRERTQQGGIRLSGRTFLSAYAWRIWIGILAASIILFSFWIVHQNDRHNAEAIFIQDGMSDIQPDGLIRNSGTFAKPNRSSSATRIDHFFNSDFVHIERMRDSQGRPLRFSARPDSNNTIEYNITLNEAVPPGGMISVTSEGTLTGLVKATSKPGVFEYSLNHSPACDSVTRYTHTYRLPAGAVLLEKKPNDLTQHRIGNRIELSIDRLIPSFGSIDVRFRYKLEKADAAPALETPNIKNSKAFIGHLQAGEFDAAMAMCNDLMRGAMSAKQLAGLWKQLGDNGGKFIGTGAIEAAEEVGFSVVYVNCEWEKNRLALKLVWDTNGKVTGLWIVPPRTGK